jgi:endonuclease/exonuclease/phosphatase family metal-dependent hydrolase
MIHKFLVRQRTVLGRPVREPALPALVLAALALLLPPAVCAVAVYYVATCGFGWLAFVAVAGLLAALLVLPRLRRRADAAPPTGRTRWLRRVRGATRALLAVMLAAWLGLIAWSELTPGGPMPPGPEPGAVRVLTWNVLHGSDDGPPWEQQSWPARKHALAAVLREARPDILCVQEARPGQVAFLEQTLAGHKRVGVGRDDGRDQGEHCAIFFRRDRFRDLGHGTFWLQEPTDQPAGPGHWVKRTCTWVRLRERGSGRVLRVANAHLPGRTAAAVRGQSRLSASRLVLDHIKAADPGDAVVLTADFNAGPDAPSRRVFAEAGLRETAALAGTEAAPTYQFYGLRLGSLDGILVGPGWGVLRHAVVDVKPDGVFPSDHFGVLADLTLSRSGASGTGKVSGPDQPVRPTRPT